ncbi:hypothetical protein Tco_1020564, partial [Tanacetum coccineum]
MEKTRAAATPRKLKNSIVSLPEKVEDMIRSEEVVINMIGSDR